MPRRPKNKTHEAELLAPVPVEVLDQFVQTGRSPRRRSRPPRDASRRRSSSGRWARSSVITSGYPAGAAKPDDTTNHRNGTSGKTVLTDDGPLPIEVPRDRDGTFEPR